MKSKEQILFELVNSIGEVLHDSVHIINMTEVYPDYSGEKSYRIYHSDGYCVDVFKKADSINKETGEVLEYLYDYYQEWDGFLKVKIDDIISELQFLIMKLKYRN